MTNLKYIQNKIKDMSETQFARWINDLMKKYLMDENCDFNCWMCPVGVQCEGNCYLTFLVLVLRVYNDKSRIY